MHKTDCAVRPSRRRLTSIGALAALALGASALLLSGSAPASGVTPSTALTGHFDSVTVQTGRLAIHGWAADTRTPHTSVNIRYAVSSESGGTWIARDARPGVAAAYPDLGPYHGFIVPTYAAAGPHHVCVSIVDPRGGPDRPLGCLNATVPADRLARGHLDAVTSAPAAHVHVAGWAFDPDVATQPWRVSIYLGGTYGHAFKSVSAAADLSRPDVAAAYPGAGAAHGFDLSIAARPGTYPVCAYAPDDYPYGASKLIGCITVTV